jgi:hypothetical protein
MNVRRLIALARAGRPDLAAKNLGANPVGAWAHPVRLLRILQRYPHSSGQVFSLAYLGLCWRDGRMERVS